MLHVPKRDKKQYIASVVVSANMEEAEDYKRITSAIPDQSDTKLKLYDQSVIHPVGSTKLHCTVNGLTTKIHFEIVEHVSTSLSRRASEVLRRIHFNEVNSSCK